MAGDSDLLNVRETARRLGVHENTVRNWARSGVLADARVPGSRFHRFRVDDVERLLAQRGAAVPSLQSERRTVNPELVSASQLVQWPSARAKDAQAQFPELIRRLLVETPDITGISVRSGDGVALPGYDGLAEATSATAFLPAGHLAFEFGVNKDPSAKATTDYDGRASEGPSDKVFVFMTPRRWAGKDAWAEERRKQKVFADVRVLDADDLEGWLRSSPAAHYWISEHLGLRPRDAQTIEDWWRRFSDSTSPPLPEGLFLAGRAAQSEQLLAQLGGAPTLTVIESEWRQDCLAFIYASTHDNEGRPSTEERSVVVVTARDVWDRILEQPGRSVLIPLFDEANVSQALDQGHHVISVVDRAAPSRRGVDIKLPRADRPLAVEAFQSAGVEFRKADRLAVMARRSMPALARHLSLNPRFQRPEWAAGVDAALLAPLVLVGSWTTSGEDIAALQRLTGHNWDVIEETALRLFRSSDPVLRKVGSTWMFASPEEAFLLLRDGMTDRAIAAWRAEVRSILLEPNPLLGLPPEARLAAQVHGTDDRCSATMKRGLAQGLALLGAMGSDNFLDDRSSLSEVASGVVRDLLRTANSDPTGRSWELLGRQLALVAEAAPGQFLDAVDEGLSGSQPILVKLFRENEESSLSLGPSSPHPDLLWAIETVSWSPTYLVDAVRCLARLAELVPGGKSGNNPLNSLAAILCGWVRNTGAPIETRLQALDAAFGVSDEVGWNLLFELWPSRHGWVMPPAEPHVRDDWRPTRSSLPVSEWAAFAHALVERAVGRAGTNGRRLRKLVSGMASVSPSDRERILDHLENISLGDTLDADARLEVWDKVQALVARHERFSTSDWAMPREVLDRLKSLAGSLEPSSDPQRHAYLFDWHPDLPGYEQSNFDAYSVRLTDLRAEALREILGRPDWAVQVAALADRVKVPGHLGWALAAETEVDASIIVSWLNDGVGAKIDMALNYVRKRITLGGPEWLLSFLQLPDLTDEARQAVLRQVPPEARFWQALRDSPGPTDADTYWATAPMEVVDLDDAPEAIGELIAHGRAWSAIAVASYALDMAEREPEKSAALGDIDLVSVLSAALTQEPLQGEIGQMTSYYLGEVLDYLTSTDTARTQVAVFEFAFYRLLEHHREPVVLNEALATEPDLFVDLVKRVFRGKNEPRRKRADGDDSQASQAWWVLHGWQGYPGRNEDGTLDAEVMKAWVAAARLELSDADRADIGDEMIGQAFAHSPAGEDGVWPAEPVRDLLETIGSREMENGLVIGRLNSRGVTSRGVYDGGDQERALASKYRDGSTLTKAKWPRTSRILRSIAESYERDAKREDLEAELDADQT